MAKDRAKDTKRVYQNPISHVKVHPNIDEQSSGYERNRLHSIKHNRKKVDSAGWTDEQRTKHAKHDVDDIKDYNETQGGGRPLKLNP